MNKRQVIVVNQFNSDNLGDRLLNIQLCKGLAQRGFESCNLGFAQTTTQSISYDEPGFKFSLSKLCPESLKYHLKYYARLLHEVETLHPSDYHALIIGGGQLIKHKSVFLECLHFWINWANANNLPICIYGVGVDTGINGKEHERYKKLLNQVKYINCRDSLSKTILENYFDLHDIKTSPDIAFTYVGKSEVLDKTGIIVMPYSHKTAVKCFSFSSDINNYYKQIFNDIQSEYIDGEPILIAAATSSDAAESVRYCDYLKSMGIDANLMRTGNVETLMELLSKSRVVITGRMHTMIMALMHNTIVKPIIISDKIKEFKRLYLDSAFDMGQVEYLASQGLDDLCQFLHTM